MRNTPGLPDPRLQPGFYENVLTKRLLAWVIDTAIAAIGAALLLPFTLFVGILVFPLMVMAVGFFYRLATISVLSGTLGMRLLGMELRDRDGWRLSRSDAFWHTLGYTVSVLAAPAQAISICSMVLSPRKQGLSDHVLGTALINRPLT